MYCDCTYNAGFLQVSSWLVLQVNKGTVVLTTNNSSLAFEAELRGPPSGLSFSYSPSLIYPARRVAFQLKQSRVRLLYNTNQVELTLTVMHCW